MYNMNTGYRAYSMSNRAYDAYNNGEKPLSKWNKGDILGEVKEYAKETDLNFSMSIFENAPKSVMSDLVLRKSSWHHTSSYCNSTDFYSVDFDLVKMLTDEQIKDAIEEYKKNKDIKPVNKQYRGSITYLEWGGTRKHPTATEHTLEDVNIEEKGCFYIITDDIGNQLLKKKIGSNGTYVKILLC